MGKPCEITYDGITYPSEKNMCEALGKSYNTYKARKARKWSLEECINGKCITHTKIYNNKIIHDIEELIRELKSLPNIEQINLIDYENVSDNKLLIENHLNDPGHINIFFFNACICSNNYYGLLKDNKSINFQIVSLQAANQLIDHMLVFYLGALVCNFPEKKYKIYSNDSGYHPFVSSLNYDNIQMVSLVKPAKKGYKYLLGKYILETEEIIESKYFSKEEVKNLFNTFFKGKKYNSRVLSNLLNELYKFDFVDVVKLNKIPYYRFHVKKIAEYVDNKERQTRA